MKTKVSLFFFILFVGIVVSPTIIGLINQKKEVAIFLDLNENKQSNGGECTKDLKFKVCFSQEEELFLSKEIQKSKNIPFYSKNYISECPKISTPPPKLIL